MSSKENMLRRRSLEAQQEGSQQQSMQQPMAQQQFSQGTGVGRVYAAARAIFCTGFSVSSICSATNATRY